PSAQGEHETLIARLVGQRHAIECDMNRLASVILDLDAPQLGAGADIERCDAVGPVSTLAGEALDQGRAASLAQQNEVAHMRGLRRSRAPEMDDLNRAVEHHPGLER